VAAVVVITNMTILEGLVVLVVVDATITDGEDLEYTDKEIKEEMEVVVTIILVQVVVVRELLEVITQNTVVEQQMVLVVQEKQLL
jgi:hypothetical protein